MKTTPGSKQHPLENQPNLPHNRNYNRPHRTDSKITQTRLLRHHKMIAKRIISAECLHTSFGALPAQQLPLLLRRCPTDAAPNTLPPSLSLPRNSVESQQCLQVGGGGSVGGGAVGSAAVVLFGFVVCSGGGGAFLAGPAFFYSQKKLATRHGNIPVLYAEDGTVAAKVCP